MRTRTGSSPEDALLEQAAEADRATAKEITAQLDGLPLALDQAGAYIEETGCGLLGYLELYRSHALELLRHRGALPSDRTAAKTPSAAPVPGEVLGGITAATPAEQTGLGLPG